MSSPRILILRAPGTNCDVETAFAFEQAGGQPERHHLNRLLDDPGLAERFQILCIPGGFSYGDDVAAGRIFANQIYHHLAEALQAFRDAGKLILGICNGFQVLVKSGLLDTTDDAGPAATLTWNDSHRFIDRWVRLQVEQTACQCVFLNGIEQLYLPIAHAEGKFVARDDQAFQRIEQAGQLVLRYEPSDNPNGAMGDVAGMCDTTGRVFGMMPHPERFIDRTQHPSWTRMPPEEPQENCGEGMVLFRNAVRYFQ